MDNSWEEFISTDSYSEAAKFYESLIDLDSSAAVNYCYLGLLSLLEGKEEEAQLTWFLGIENSSCTDSFIENLCRILICEASRQENLKEYQTSWLIRQHIRQVSPEDFDNLVQIVYLSLHLKLLTIDVLYDLDIINLLDSDIEINVTDNLLLQLIQNVLHSPIPYDQSLEFLCSFLPYIQDKQTCIEMLVYIAGNACLDLGLKIVNLCLLMDSDNVTALGCSIHLYISHGYYAKAIEIASNINLTARNIYQRFIAQHLLLSALMSTGGRWKDAEVVFNAYMSLVESLIKQNSIDIPTTPLSYICLSCFFAPYFHDTPQLNRTRQNQALNLYQANIQHSNREAVELYQRHQLARKTKIRNKKLKIGYLSTSLRKHSIGWLARSLFQYHNREEFEIYGYFPEYQQGQDILQQWYVGQMDKVFRNGVEFWGNELIINDQIDRDEIDILVDLESITSGICCNLLACKPAPIQVSWLGWDASGIPAIDYYIADPYVLPDNAQDYYSEKIWRLPQTYIAVEGFNYSLSSLRRQKLNIPTDAVIYFSSQKSYKRHPETVRAQLKIIKQVPNSYFLIKGLADENDIQNFFYEIAESEGVKCDQLIFLPVDDSEEEHRANLSIADVVLDTYPYNGATTTMETLWMEIPLVTRVGEQFVSRNSYSMMMNAGISEGIAWNEEEYIEWGVRFGTEPALRQNVSWKLRQSRKYSPLWNGKQFAKEMEKAYQQMWEIYNG